MKRVVLGAWLSAAVSMALAQGPVDSATCRNWAWDVMKRQTIWDRTTQKNRVPSSTADLLGQLKSYDAEARRAALVILGTRPHHEWAEEALKVDADEAAVYLFRHGYKRSGQDAFSYLGQDDRPARPWTHGLGLHLETDGSWRFQWIPSPTLMGLISLDPKLPEALSRAAQPSVMLQLKQLRPGLLRLREMAGGKDGLGRTLAQGSRAGFLLDHVEKWLDQGATVLEPLAQREAWILHYGRAKGEVGPKNGTLVFIPGDMPLRAELGLGLLKLNPFAKGIRSRSETWNGPGGAKATITQIRGAGGVLHLHTDAAGTWISDREAPLRSLLFPDGATYLAERPDWCKVALAGARPTTAVSLWMLPQTAGGAAFERLAMVRRRTRAQGQSWPNPFISKAAPRAGTVSFALGAGPTEAALRSILRVDHPFALLDPQVPTFTENGQRLTEEQRKRYQASVEANKGRRQERDQVKQPMDALMKLLDIRGASFMLDGFVPAPNLTVAQKKVLADYRVLRSSDWEKAQAMVDQGKLAFLGGFTEPGFAPAVALALPIAQGKEIQVQQVLDQLWPRLFSGKVQVQDVSGVRLRRTRTGQALNPTYCIVEGHLVVGTDDGPVKSVLAGLKGQAPTLADWQSQAFGRAEIDGTRAAKDLEALLLAYLRSHGSGGPWWDAAPTTEDDARAELAATFAPFLGAIQGLGRRSLDLHWTPAGLEASPR